MAARTASGGSAPEGTGLVMTTDPMPPASVTASSSALMTESGRLVSETITTHEYESKVLGPAFTAITGIKVTHDLIGEGDA